MIGGTPREILEDVVEADWAPDGKDLAVVRGEKGKFRLEYPIGRVLYETRGYISYPRFSPDGTHIAFMDHPDAFDNRGSISVVDLAGKKSTLTPEFPGEEGIASVAAELDAWGRTLARHGIERDAAEGGGP